MNELIDLYESWNKPEKAEQWRAKMLQTEAVNERHNALKMTQLSFVKSQYWASSWRQFYCGYQYGCAMQPVYNQHGICIDA
jgi:hypothetical protein